MQCKFLLQKQQQKIHLPFQTFKTVLLQQTVLGLHLPANSLIICKVQFAENTKLKTIAWLVNVFLSQSLAHDTGNPD